VNRAGAPVDRLPWRPAHVAPDLTAVPDIAAAA
jgi:2-haloacid dehalogenase